MNQYNNWTEQQINREIGKRCHFVVEPNDDPTLKDRYPYMFYQAEVYGEKGRWGLCGAQTEDEGWGYLRFACNVDEAMSLLDYVPEEFRLSCEAGNAKEGNWRASFMPSNVHVAAQTPARAICILFLEWDDNKAKDEL